ncbi:hypothetical protein RJ641_011588 [Dillenia turbinata]|uniref:Uncharacterized protein n=1 Tax=Dillenia turbinata TaxID=194707 RepID=A0AAN8V1R6_9MAGN
MGEGEGEAPPSDSLPAEESSPLSLPPPQEEKPWHATITEDLPRTVMESTDSALRSARTLQHSSSTHLRNLRDLIPEIKSQYKIYEDAFFTKVEDELIKAKEHPALAAGVAFTAGLLLMRGPRRFLYRQTLGRFQSEEAKFVGAEKNVKELNLSVDLMKKESKKLLERAALAEKDMIRGNSELKEIPGRDALKLRAEAIDISNDVASMSSLLRQQRIALNKRIVKISDLGVPV